jgi:hypothetical protein
MIEALITLEAGKNHLQMDHDADDFDIEAKIFEASAIVLDYLKLADAPAAWAELVPEHIQAATKLVLGSLYKNRESEIAEPLSAAVKSLLHRSRDPALA